MSTPLPGTEVDSATGAEVFARFLGKFRSDSPLRDIPTHCDFVNAGSLFWGQVFNEDWIPNGLPVYFIEETGRMQRYPQAIHAASMAQVRDYLRRRELWEFADCYIMDEPMTWCIVITHDDVCRYAQPVGGPDDAK